MKVLIIGGTGMIGTAVVKALIRHGDSVCGLARSSAAAEKLSALGAATIQGSIQTLNWESAVADSEAVIHCAYDRQANMTEVDKKLMEWLLPQLGPKPFIYTGSCWVFGEGELGEAMPFVRNAALTLDWLIDGCEAALTAAHGLVIHPACVYGRDADGRLNGTLHRYTKEAEKTETVAVVKSPEVRSPWIEEDDLGELYAIILHKGQARTSYNASGFVESNGNAARAAANAAGKTEVNIKSLSSTEAHEQMAGVCAVGYSLDIPSFETSRAAALGWIPKHSKFNANKRKYSTNE